MTTHPYDLASFQSGVEPARLKLNAQAWFTTRLAISCVSRWPTYISPGYFAAFFLEGFVLEGLAFAVFFAALASLSSANTFSIRRT